MRNLWWKVLLLSMDWTLNASSEERFLVLNVVLLVVQGVTNVNCMASPITTHEYILGTTLIFQTLIGMVISNSAGFPSYTSGFLLSTVYLLHIDLIACYSHSFFFSVLRVLWMLILFIHTISNLFTVAFHEHLNL